MRFFGGTPQKSPHVRCDERGDLATIDSRGHIVGIVAAAVLHKHVDEADMLYPSPK